MASEGGDYFPLEVGNRWKYDVDLYVQLSDTGEPQRAQGTFVSRIVDATLLDEDRVYTICDTLSLVCHVELPGSTVPWNTGDTSIAYLLDLANDVYRCTSMTVMENRIWMGQHGYTDGEDHVNQDGDTTEIDYHGLLHTSAGSFAGCYVLTDADADTQRTYYAPNIGMVKRTKNGHVVLELVRWDAASSMVSEERYRTCNANAADVGSCRCYDASGRRFRLRPANGWCGGSAVGYRVLSTSTQTVGTVTGPGRAWSVTR